VTAGAPEPGGLKTANAADGLLTDPDQAGHWEPFTYEAEPGVWPVAKWELTPKLATNGWWFPHWWLGPGSRWWQGPRATTCRRSRPRGSRPLKSPLRLDRVVSRDRWLCSHSGVTAWAIGRTVATRTVRTGTR
jgi:hypothetical protein